MLVNEFITFQLSCLKLYKLKKGWAPERILLLYKEYTYGMSSYTNLCEKSCCENRKIMIAMLKTVSLTEKKLLTYFSENDATFKYINILYASSSKKDKSVYKTILCVFKNIVFRLGWYEDQYLLEKLISLYEQIIELKAFATKEIGIKTSTLIFSLIIKECSCLIIYYSYRMRYPGDLKETALSVIKDGEQFMSPSIYLGSIKGVVVDGVILVDIPTIIIGIKLDFERQAIAKEAALKKAIEEAAAKKASAIVKAIEEAEAKKATEEAAAKAAAKKATEEAAKKDYEIIKFLFN